MPNIDYLAKMLCVSIEKTIKLKYKKRIASTRKVIENSKETVKENMLRITKKRFWKIKGKEEKNDLKQSLCTNSKNKQDE